MRPKLIALTLVSRHRWRVRHAGHNAVEAFPVSARGAVLNAESNERERDGSARQMSAAMLMCSRMAWARDGTAFFEAGGELLEEFVFHGIRFGYALRVLSCAGVRPSCSFIGATSRAGWNATELFRYARVMLRALIFDFDGLILDTETPEFHAWQEIYRLHGAELALEDWLPCIGTGSVFDPHSHMEMLIGRALDRDEIAAARQIRNRELITRERLRPGVLATLENARELDLRIGLASSSSRSWVEPHLQRLGISDFFETLHTGDLVEKVKPDPELYLRAVASLGVAPSEAIALEDSLNGLHAARAAGLFTVVIPNAMTRHMDLGEADLLLESMEKLDLAMWPFRNS